MEFIDMKISLLIMIVALGALFFPWPVLAYLGPGGAITSIGALLAVIAGIIAAIFGFLWYPIRRLIRKWKK
jgi:hypothetical protein